MQENNAAQIKKKKLPIWVKAMAIKAWFAGAVYFFIGIGLFINSSDQLDITLAIGLVLGIVLDVAENRAFRWMERGRKEYHPYMMFPKRAIYNFFLNILYGIVLAFMVAYTYNFINIMLINLRGLPDTAIVFGADPVMFGIMCMAYDMIFIQAKKGVLALGRRCFGKKAQAS